jgi:cell shape-determining protein MreD
VYIKVISHLILIIIIALIDIAFMSRLPLGLHRVHLFPIMLLFVFLLGNIRYSAWWVIGGSYFLELFSFGVYGLHFLGLGLALGAIYILFEQVMTNRSLYSIAVVSGVSVFLYNSSLFLEIYIGNQQRSISWPTFFTEQGVTILYSIAIATVLFYLINAATKRLRPVFLAQRGYKI